MEDVRAQQNPTSPELHHFAQQEMESPPPSAFGDGYFPGLEAVGRNLEQLRQTLNQKHDLKLWECDKTAEDLESETRIRFESEDIPEPGTPPTNWNHTFLRYRWNVPGPGPEPSIEEVVHSLLPIIGPPLIPNELQLLYENGLELCQSAFKRLATELDEEKRRIKRFTRSGECTASTYEFLRDEEAGRDRIDSIAKHLIRSRWERLERGEKRPSVDETGTHNSGHLGPRKPRSLCDLDEDTPEDCLFRLVNDRWGQCRGEYKTVPWLRSSDDNARPTRVWDWITSRPWFVFELEKFEELIRFYRLPRQIRDFFYSAAPEGPNDLTYLSVRITKLWEARSLLDPEWDTPSRRGGAAKDWWWPRGAQRSVEENLTVLNNTDWLKLIVHQGPAPAYGSPMSTHFDENDAESGAEEVTESDAQLPMSPSLPEDPSKQVNFDLPAYSSDKDAEEARLKAEKQAQIEPIVLSWIPDSQDDTESLPQESHDAGESPVRASVVTPELSNKVEEVVAVAQAGCDDDVGMNDMDDGEIVTDEQVVQVQSPGSPGTSITTEAEALDTHLGIAPTQSPLQANEEAHSPMSGPEFEITSVTMASEDEGDTIMSDPEPEGSPVSEVPVTQDDSTMSDPEAEDFSVLRSSSSESDPEAEDFSVLRDSSAENCGELIGKEYEDLFGLEEPAAKSDESLLGLEDQENAESAQPVAEEGNAGMMEATVEQDEPLPVVSEPAAEDDQTLSDPDVHNIAQKDIDISEPNDDFILSVDDSAAEDNSPLIDAEDQEAVPPTQPAAEDDVSMSEPEEEPLPIMDEQVAENNVSPISSEGQEAVHLTQPPAETGVSISEPEDESLHVVDQPLPVVDRPLTIVDQPLPIVDEHVAEDEASPIGSEGQEAVHHSTQPEAENDVVMSEPEDEPLPPMDEHIAENDISLISLEAQEAVHSTQPAAEDDVLMSEPGDEHLPIVEEHAAEKDASRSGSEAPGILVAEQPRPEIVIDMVEPAERDVPTGKPDDDAELISDEEEMAWLRALGIPGLPSSDRSVYHTDAEDAERRASYQACGRSRSDSQFFLANPLGPERSPLGVPEEEPVYKPVDWTGPSTANVIENLAPDVVPGAEEVQSKRRQSREKSVAFAPLLMPRKLSLPDLPMHPRYQRAFQASKYNRVSLRKYVLLRNLPVSKSEVKLLRSAIKKLAEENLKGAWPNGKERHDYRIPPYIVDTYKNEYDLQEWTSNGPSPVAFELDADSSGESSSSIENDALPEEVSQLEPPAPEACSDVAAKDHTSDDLDTIMSIETDQVPQKDVVQEGKPSILGPSKPEGVKKRKGPKKAKKAKKMTEKAMEALEDAVQLESPPSSDSGGSDDVVMEILDTEDSSSPVVVLLDESEPPVPVKKESPDVVEKSDVLGPLHHGVKKRKTKKHKPKAKSLVAALERTGDLEVSATGEVSVLEELPWWSPESGQAQESVDDKDGDYTPGRSSGKKRAKKDVKSAVLGPVENGGVKKQVSKKDEAPGGLRRSTRGAARSAATKISQAYESGLL